MITIQKDEHGMYIAVDQENQKVNIGRTPQAALSAVLGESTIAEARALIKQEFSKDPDWKRTYIDNVACLLDGEKAERDRLAERILDTIF